MQEPYPNKDSDDKSTIAVDAAAAHAFAVEEARKAQVEEAVNLAREETKKIFVHAMREVLTQGDEGTKALLIQKIPLLCVDILKIKGDLGWIKWLLTGMIGGIGALTITLLANLHS